jgi:hypothetical protein
LFQTLGIGPVNGVTFKNFIGLGLPAVYSESKHQQQHQQIFIHGTNL